MKVEEIGVLESEKGYWEIIQMMDENLDFKEDFRLLFVPDGDDYSDKDRYFSVTKEQLEDLVGMIKNNI